ncbi:Chloramphenicol acetyltransferase [compost metagenome]
MILEGVTVGTGAIIATRAVVAHDVPPYAIVAGVPAKVVKYRHAPHVIEELISSKWWDREVGDLQALPLNDPLSALAKLAAMKKESAADYKQIQITRKKCRVLSL